MDIASVLTDILIVLVAAKVAAEVAERVGVPAVVGEILAGIIVGPSLLNAVGAHDEVLRTLGEIGVILLLLEVGMEMDLAELGKVGRASVAVATVGVVVPLALGLGAMELIGDDFNTSLFVAAALTATSVGITARVFGDLRALATTEARIVLGAAVADDVMGLVVLTVVVRLVTEGTVSVAAVGGIVAIAIGFLVIGGAVGLRVSGPLFALVERGSRSTGTMVALALAFALAFARLADAAGLAPIVGAFVAGIALTRSSQADRIKRELAPVGHLFIPVFFLQIGIDAQLDAFTRPAVLRDAAVLLAVAVIGKLASPIGALGVPGDKLLIGIGMLPRGEVGLIFATIGLQNGVLGDELYASLLLVVLITTLVTPQLLRMRYTRLRAGGATPIVGEPEPDDGWLKERDGLVVLQATPPSHLLLPIGFEAARRLAAARPSDELLDWLSATVGRPVVWDRQSTRAFLDLIANGNARSWRFLDSVGLLERAMPELAQALEDRKADPFEFDPSLAHRWVTIERLRGLEETDVAAEFRSLTHREWLLLAGLLHDALDDRADRVFTARRVVQRLDLGAAAEQQIALLVMDVDLLWSAAQQSDALSESSVFALASHLENPETARALFLLTLAVNPGATSWRYDTLTELHALIQRALSQPELTGRDARNLLKQRQAQAIRLAGPNPAVVKRIDESPRAYALLRTPEELARQCQLLDPVPSATAVRVTITPFDGHWIVDVVARDRPWLLASVTGALAAQGEDVDGAIVATWPDGVALESFRVIATDQPDADVITQRIERDLGAKRSSPAIPEASIEFDNSVSPWHTVCEIRAPDKPGLLNALATAMAAAEVEVHSARVSSESGLALDRFEVTDRNGHKLMPDRCEAVVAFVNGGSVSVRRGFRFGRNKVKARVADSSLVGR